MPGGAACELVAFEKQDIAMPKPGEVESIERPMMRQG